MSAGTTSTTLLPRRPALRALAALALAPFALPGRAAAAAEAETFQFRGRDYTPTGSTVVRRMTWAGRLPFDKTYAELTPAQVTYVRDAYNGLADDEVPPWPREGLRTIFERFDREITPKSPRPEPGEVVAVAKIDAAGVAQSVAVYKSPHPFITAALTQALLLTPFDPGRKAGQPVAMPFLLRMDVE